MVEYAGTKAGDVVSLVGAHMVRCLLGGAWSGVGWGWGWGASVGFGGFCWVDLGVIR
jgi:hypothetical protein